MAKAKLALTYWGLILAYLILNIPLASVLLGTFFLSVPRELEEAAEMDGASRIQTFSGGHTDLLASIRFSGDHNFHSGVERVSSWR